MVHTLLMVVFVLVAIAMVVLILLQRGAGAQAGSGFGAGASGTVFGSRGSANFLSSSTKWLAAVFFALSLFMAWQSAHQAKGTGKDAAAAKADLGIMGNLPADAVKTPAAPAHSRKIPERRSTVTYALLRKTWFNANAPPGHVQENMSEEGLEPPTPCV